MTTEKRHLIRRLHALQARIPAHADLVDKDVAIAANKDVLGFMLASEEPMNKTSASLRLANETLDHFERYIQKREASWQSNRQPAMA